MIEEKTHKIEHCKKRAVRLISPCEPCGTLLRLLHRMEKALSSVVGSLGPYPYIESGRIFMKTAPNTF